MSANGSYTAEENTILKAAYEALDAGFSIVAIRRIGELYFDPEKNANITAGPKSPKGRWKPFQIKAPTHKQVSKWFTEEQGRGFAVILGPVSGNAECLEFDDLETEQAFEQAATTAGLMPILERIRAGYSERSPKGTSHFIYRCEVVGGSMKLALEPTGEKDTHGNDKLRTLAETKGDRSYVIVAPSPGTVHSTGRPYVCEKGSLATVATITVDERTQLLALAATFDKTPEVKAQPKRESKAFGQNKPSGDKLRPGDDYNARATLDIWSELLSTLNWTRTSQGNGREFWKHPGTDKDISAVCGGNKNVMVVHSTSTIFDAWSPSDPKSYTPFAAYTAIYHKNDYKAAAKALALQGYGTQTPRAKFTKPTSPTPGTSSTDPTDPEFEPTAESEAEPELDIHLTDVGNALRFVADHAENIRYVPGWGWVIWDTRRWERDEAGRAQEFAKRTVANMYAEAAARMRALADELQAMSGEEGEIVTSGLTDEEQERSDKLKGMMKAAKKFLDWAMSSEHVARIGAMLSLAKTDVRIVATVDQFDTDQFAFNVENGTIDLKAAELREHRREDYITRLSPVKFSKDAKCPNWERFVTSTFAADSDLIQWMQKWSGYCLTGDVREQCMAILHGAGSNGKSVYIETTLDLMGDYGLKANSELLLASKSDRHPTEKAQLAGRRFVAACETGEGRRLDEVLVKEATGGDTITAHFMRQDNFSFLPTFKFDLATNHRPEVRGTDHGIWRRVKLVPFIRRFWKAGEQEGAAELKADPLLREKLKAELPGILLWFVLGAADWHIEGLGTCKAVEAATRDYRDSEDVIGQFVEEQCERDAGASVRASELFGAYNAWAEKRNEKPFKQTTFGRRIGEMGFEKRKSNGVIWDGIKLRTSWNTGTD